MVDYQTISIVLTGVGMIIALTYYSLQIRNQNRTRQAQLFMSIYQSMNTSEGLEAGQVILDVKMKTVEDLNRLGEDREKYKAWNWFGNFLEGIGVLVKDNLVDIGHVAQLVSGLILWYWEEYGEVIKAAREELGWPRYSIEVEYLYNRVVEYAEAHPELKIESPSRMNP